MVLDNIVAVLVLLVFLRLSTAVLVLVHKLDAEQK